MGDFARKKILIVDDEELLLMLTQRALAEQYDTVCASSGAEAVRLFESERPDMVLSDLRMPGMSGYELQKILQEKSGARVPVMFMTADDSDESESRVLAQGAVDYIRKPLKKELLLRRVENILRNLDHIQGLERAAETDAMTGLLNKAASGQAIGAMCAGKEGALLMIDLDSFKLVNDLYGHEMGDRVLIRFSELLRSVIRAQDAAGRIGGDEFIAFCQNLRDESVIAGRAAYLNRELLASAREFMGAEMDIPLGVSIGAVFVPDEGTDYQTVCQKADQALYQVKQHGKHGYALYGTGAHQEEAAPAGDMAQLQTILAERSMQGAYVVDFDRFRTIYRFLARYITNYGNKVQLIQFTLTAGAGAPDDLTAYCARFLELLAANLRVSDIVAAHGDNQFLLLLMDVDPLDALTPLTRITRRWKEEEASASCELTYEMKPVGAALSKALSLPSHPS